MACGNTFHSSLCGILQSTLSSIAFEHERALTEQISVLRKEINLLRRNSSKVSATPSDGTTESLPDETPLNLPVSVIHSAWQMRTLRPEGPARGVVRVPTTEISIQEPSSPGKEYFDSMSVLQWGENSPGAVMRQGSRLTLQTLQSTTPWKRGAQSVIHDASARFMSERKGFSVANFSFEKLRYRESWKLRLETLMCGLIVLNAVAVGVSTEFKPNWVGWVFVETAFVTAFTTEALVKMTWQGCRKYMCGTWWRLNVFELILVVMGWCEVAFMVAEVSFQSSTALLRIARTLRVAKLMRLGRVQVIKELLIVIRGAALLYSLLLIVIPLYGFALLLKDTVGTYADHGAGAQNFGSLSIAFFTLFRCFVAGDCTEDDGKPVFVLISEAYGWVYGVLYCLVQFLMTFGLFNVIAAIYVESTVTAAKFNDQAIKRQRFMDHRFFTNKAQVLLKLIWEYHIKTHKDRGSRETLEDFTEEAAGKLKLTEEVFEELCALKDFRDILRDLDISEDDQLDLFGTLDVEGRGSIDLTEFIIGIGKLRGEARKADIVSVGLILRSMQHKLNHMEAKVISNSKSQLSVKEEGSRVSMREEG